MAHDVRGALRTRLSTKCSVALAAAILLANPAGAQLGRSPDQPTESDVKAIEEWQARSPTRDPSLDLNFPQLADPNHLASLVGAAESVFDGVLSRAETYIPEGHRVLVTSYAFAVDEWLKGGDASNETTLISLGGEDARGKGMTTSGSVRLTVGRRYIILTRAGSSDLMLPFLRVFQVFELGDIVSDEAGRVLTDLVDGRIRTRLESETGTLDYLSSGGRANPSRTQELPDDLVGSDSEAAPEEPGSPLTAEEFLDEIGSALAKARDALTTGTNKLSAIHEIPTPSYRWCGRIRGPQNYYAWIPINANWDWWGGCAGNWNALVDDNPAGEDWLIGYFTSGGNPIRDRVPVADDGDNNTGVPTDAQLLAGGYGGTWASFSANGLNFTWYFLGLSCTEILEVDTFVNPAIDTDEAQFRKSMTHEMGHALGQGTTGAGGHEDRTYALMYPGTFRQPPNYASIWYGRMDDMAGVRSFVANSNANWPNTWVFEQWTDMATWSQTHDNWGSSGNLVMTSLSTYTARRGESLTMNGIQVENRGNQAATNVRLAVRLSTNNIISASDDEVGSATWSTFSAEGRWDNGSRTLTIPSHLAPGDYYIGWIITQDQSERSSSNNVAIMMRDHFSSFTERQITVLGNPDLVVTNPSVSDPNLETGESFTIFATTHNQGDADSASSTLRFLLSNDATIDGGDTQLSTDPVSALTPGGDDADNDPESAPSVPGTYWVGACVDAVSFESDTANNCSAAVQITVTRGPDLIVDSVGVSSSTLQTGQTFTLSATTRNQGDVTSAATTLRYKLSSDPVIETTDTQMSTDNVASLPPATGDPESDQETAPAVPGTYWVGGCADPVAGESDTTNNCSVGVQISVTAGPDLVVESPAVDKSSLAPGESFTASATTRNQGTAASPSSTLRFMLSPDPTISTADTQMSTDPVSALAPSGSEFDSDLETAPVSPGTYWVGACADSVPGELTTTNNCSGGVEITVAGCIGSDEEELADIMITTIEQYAACQQIMLGPNLEILSPAVVTLYSPGKVVFRNGVQVGLGAELTVVNGSP